MTEAPRLDVQVWAPLPPLPSGVADYVHEQLEVLEKHFTLTLVAEFPEQVDPRIRSRNRVVAPKEADPKILRVYHVGNSPSHAYIYKEALRIPGVVVLHEWNLHELLLGCAVASRDFSAYRRQMRREHGEHGTIAADTIAATLGGRFWTGIFPLNAEILERALGLVCLAGSTAARARARAPGTPLLHLPHHCLLRSRGGARSEARTRLGLDPRAPVVLAPGLETASKSLDVVRAAMKRLSPGFETATLVCVGGTEATAPPPAAPFERMLGRVDLDTLGDALLAADVVVSLRFPSRGEVSGVVMRALAAGRAVVVSAGSTTDEDLPEGVVARVNPGPHETRELAAVLEFLLREKPARSRMETLAGAIAETRGVSALTDQFAAFLREVSTNRERLEATLGTRAAGVSNVSGRFKDELEAAARSLDLFHLPPGVFEKLAGL